MDCTYCGESLEDGGTIEVEPAGEWIQIILTCSTCGERYLHDIQIENMQAIGPDDDYLVPRGFAVSQED